MNKLKKFKAWFKDKWWWLKSFNNKPTVVINATEIYSDQDLPILVQTGRVETTINCGVLRRDGKENPYKLSTDFVQNP